MCEDDDDDDGVTENGVEWNRRSQSPERDRARLTAAVCQTNTELDKWFRGNDRGLESGETHTNCQPGAFLPPRLLTSHPPDDVLITGREGTKD